MRTLLVEIVTEEIPAGYIEPALDAMATGMGQKLTQARIGHGTIQTFGTPRRLAIVVEEVAEKQTSITTEVLGPPKRIAFDNQGHPTKAAEGFAKNQGISVKALTTKTTSKGEYLCAKKTERGRVAATLLRTIIPEILDTVPFPKSMRWGNFNLVFARPIHKIVALLDTKIISFTLENLKSGRKSLGHRFMHPKTVTIASASDYLSVMKPAFVLPHIPERKKEVEAKITEAAEKLGGQILSDEPLVALNTNLVEYVSVSAGTFDKSFLEVPDEVLITAMREHQKYFAVTDADGTLMPCFIAVNNTPVDDVSVVTSGHERVLRARLEDARFFFKGDSKTPLETMVSRLEGVTFQAKIGSMHGKMTRVQKLAEHMAGLIDPKLTETVSRAAWLCKADLTSQMVNEFPKLQGVMGRIYAKNAGESNAVARAIEEHYLPTHAGGHLPESLPGAMVSIADKLDSICSCFGVGLIPTGAADPYALRRQAVGIISILMDKGISVALSGLIEQSLAFLGNKITEDRNKTKAAVLTFFNRRMDHLLSEQGFAKDLVRAVIAVSMDDVPAVIKRVGALQSLKAKPDFDPLAVAFKRVVNIIKQATQRGDLSTEGRTIAVDPDLFEADCEQDLYRAFLQVKEDVVHHINGGDFDQAILQVAALKTSVDAFFDGVMVLTDDQKIKQNRLALLYGIADLFAIFADFSKIST